ncbi:MAG: hypothetical protein WKF92_13320 [Pyrinomonadaceae bacterium]
MSKFVVDINNPSTTEVPGFGGYTERKPKRHAGNVIAIIGISVVGITVIGAFGGYFYWRSFLETPQYSLALIIDAARNNDQAMIDQLVDLDAVVDDFLPQITSKAVELYGRGQPPQIIARVAEIAAPMLPAVKDRARAELPRTIRQKTEKFSSVPFAAMVIGAGRYLDISFEGEKALVKSRLPEHSFEVIMQKSGTRWKIVGLRDEKLATTIAQKIGQEIIGLATNGGRGTSADSLGIKNVNELLRQTEEIFR